MGRVSGAVLSGCLWTTRPTIGTGGSPTLSSHSIPQRVDALAQLSDFGYAKPFSCGWWAVDHDGCVYRILELYGCTGEPDEGVKWTPEKQFAEIRRIEDTHPWLKGRDILGVADPGHLGQASGREHL